MVEDLQYPRVYGCEESENEVRFLVAVPEMGFPGLSYPVPPSIPKGQKSFRVTQKCVFTIFCFAYL